MKHLWHLYVYFRGFSQKIGIFALPAIIILLAFPAHSPAQGYDKNQIISIIEQSNRNNQRLLEEHNPDEDRNKPLFIIEEKVRKDRKCKQKKYHDDKECIEWRRMEEPQEQVDE